MTPKQIIKRISLRCKLKTESTVEVTVMDHETMETFQILWDFRSEDSKSKVRVSKQLVLEDNK